MLFARVLTKADSGVLGHSDISMTQRYAHLSAKDLKKATAGVSEMLDQAA